MSVRMADLIVASALEQHRRFTNLKPMVVVFQTKNGYCKHPLLGGEVFSLQKIYAGKRNYDICVLKQESIGAFANGAQCYIEMPLKQAIMNLVDFRQFFSEVMATISDDYIIETRRQLAYDQEVTYLHLRRRAYNGLFGSW
jgi:hypothetical protein